MFENCLVKNMYYLLRSIEDLKILKSRGRIWISKKDDLAFTEAELETVKQQLGKAFGLENFSPGIACEPDIEQLKKVVLESHKPIFEKAFAARPGKEVSFRIRARRGCKKFPMTSQEIEIELAEVVGESLDTDLLTVDLKHADVTVGCDVREKIAFVFYETFPAPGGLPTGCNPRVLALLSGGIDSPVACYLAMKRGCPVDFITYHSYPYTPDETVEKVKRMASIINGFQQPGKLYVCNLAPIQKMIRDQCSPPFRTVLYRRMMFRIAEQVANQNNCKALLTGESVGQVASQTVVNLNTINNAIDMLVLRPLIGTDKKDAIELAGKIGTLELSNQQVPDSCTVFAPSSPSTAVPVWRIEKDEEKIPDYPQILEKIISEIEVCNYE
jgi:thiamine biosynthesis protein ThiI